MQAEKENAMYAHVPHQASAKLLPRLPRMMASTRRRSLRKVMGEKGMDRSMPFAAGFVLLHDHKLTRKTYLSR